MATLVEVNNHFIPPLLHSKFVLNLRFFVIILCLIGVMICSSNATFTTVMCSPTTDIPRLTDAVFSDSLASINLIFDVATDTSISSCDKLLTEGTMTLLGSQPVCAWSDSVTLHIYLGHEAVIVTTDSLELLGGVLKSADMLSDFTPLTIFYVRAPTNAPAVSAVLIGPELIGLCDELSLDTSMSIGGAGRPFSIEWFVSVDLNPTVNLTTLTDLNQTLTQRANEAILVLTKEELSYISNIVFQVRLTNWLLSTDDVSFRVLKQSASLPSVSSTSPMLVLYSFEELSLQSISTAPVACGSDTSSQSDWQWDVVYLWTQLTGPDLSLPVEATITSRLVCTLSHFYLSLL